MAARTGVLVAIALAISLAVGQSGAGFGPVQHVTTTATLPMSVYAADIDDDGAVDVLSSTAFDHKISWYRNMDGRGAFSSPLVISSNATGASSVFASDLDGDGDWDVLSASSTDNKIAWYRNTDGAGLFSSQLVISSNAMGASSVFASDLDGDGDVDVLSASFNDNKIAWYRNTDGVGAFSSTFAISFDAQGANRVFATDINGDSYVDVMSSSFSDGKIAWYRNTDGLGNFSAGINISVNLIFLRYVDAADLDGDGDADVIFAASFYDTIAWLRNNGTGSFSTAFLLSQVADGAICVRAADLDDDGDLDVISASTSDNKVAWYRNNGTGGFTSELIISTNADAVRFIHVADLTGDGFLEVLQATYFNSHVSYYKNGGCSNFSVPFSRAGLARGFSGSRRTVDCATNYATVNATYVCNASLWLGEPCLPVAACPTSAVNTLVSAAFAASNTANLMTTVFLDVTTRNPFNASVRCGDVLSLVLPPTMSYDVLDSGGSNFSFAVSTGTKAGPFTLFVHLNGARLAARSLVLLPNPKSVLHTTLECDTASLSNSCERFLSKNDIRLSISLRDEYDNLATSAKSADGIVVTMLSVSYASAERSLIVQKAQPGTFTVEFNLVPGLYQLTVIVDKIVALGGPKNIFLVDFCEPGSFTQVNGLCEKCPPHTFSDSSARADCTPCPNGTVTDMGAVGAVAKTNCSCEAGRYSLGGRGSECFACPLGARCAGGTELPVPKSGYARDGRLDAFALCPRPASCPDGINGCVRGYAGYLCKECALGYYADANGECRPCSRASDGLFAIFCVVLLALSLACVAVVVTNLALSTGELRVRKFPPSIPLVVTAFQIVGVLATANFGWSAGAQRALNAFSVFSLNVNLFASECTLPSFAAKYAVAVLCPLVFAGLVVLELGALRLLKPAWLRLAPSVTCAQQLLAVLCLAGPLAYLPLARSALQAFDCTRLPNGKFYLDADMSVECFSRSSSWWNTFPLAAFGVLAYVCAIPCAIAAVLVVHRDALFSNRAVINAYGSVYRLFRRPFVSMPFVLLGKKLCLACCSLFLSRTQGFQLAGFLGTILVGGLLQLHARPYYYPVYDLMEFAFTILLSLILLAGMISNAGSADARNPSVFLTVVIALCLVALVLLSCYFIALDVRDLLHEHRARRTGTGAPGLSALAKQLLALNASNLRDIDDHTNFLQLLAQNCAAAEPAGPLECADLQDESMVAQRDRRLTVVESIEMTDMPEDAHFTTDVK